MADAQQTIVCSNIIPFSDYYTKNVETFAQFNDRFQAEKIVLVQFDSRNYISTEQKYLQFFFNFLFGEIYTVEFKGNGVKN